jgi:P2-related tail formation protein
VQRLDGKADTRNAVAAASDEIHQLRATVTALREQLEQHHAG